MNLTQLATLIDGQHTPLRGYHLSVREASSTVQEKFSPHPFCLVGQWAILDLEVSADQLNALHLRGLEPVVVHALRVVLDSRVRAARLWNAAADHR